MELLSDILLQNQENSILSQSLNEENFFVTFQFLNFHHLIEVIHFILQW